MFLDAFRLDSQSSSVIMNYNLQGSYDLMNNVTFFQIGIG